MKKLIVIIIVAVFSSLSFGAQSGLFEDNVSRAIAEGSESFDQAPLKYYQEKIASITKPSYEALRPLFERLTVYNADFATDTQKGSWGKLAVALAKPVKTGWNNSIGMVEIFDNYFPKENKDDGIALLEYNVKANLISQSQREFIVAFEGADDEYVSYFKEQYDDFLNKLETATAYQPKGIVEAFGPLAEAYKKLEQDSAGAALMTRNAAFIQPFPAGWGRTTTVKELGGKLGARYGQIYSPSELQSLYNVSIDTAMTFYQFVQTYIIGYN